MQVERRARERAEAQKPDDEARCRQRAVEAELQSAEEKRVLDLFWIDYNKGSGRVE